MRSTVASALAILACALQISSTVADRSDWRVNVYLDDLCEAKLEVGDDLNTRCGFSIFACESDDCTDGWELEKGDCLRVGVGDLKKPLKSYRVYETPC
ncbi:hypothetical protein ETB97_010214 [Aspergillus alliaceus]|uniref:Uncharacterized protein n=1 Tax=Petromyces alliaceus TaxID=209559 RepID=A0A8H6E1A1_PETAA|nr:hypothetical protein ETB97_010214 [Aspergillus burnettii]